MLSLAKRFNKKIDSIVPSYDSYNKAVLELFPAKLIATNDFESFCELNKDDNFIIFIKKIVEIYKELRITLIIDEHIINRSNMSHALNLDEYVTFFKFYHKNIFEPWLKQFYNLNKNNISEINQEVLLTSFLENINHITMIKPTKQEFKDLLIESLDFVKGYKIDIYPMFLSLKSGIKLVNKKKLILIRGFNCLDFGTLIWDEKSDSEIYPKIQKILGNALSRVKNGNCYFCAITYESFDNNYYYDWLIALEEFKKILEGTNE